MSQAKQLPATRSTFISNFLSWFKSPEKEECNHVYCYRSRVCTRCGHLHTGPKEPEYTPHFMIDGKLVPKTDIEQNAT